MKTLSRILGFVPALSLAAIALLLGGCANLVGNSAPGGQMVFVETENVYVTGSHIPVRVPKNSSARPLVGISPLSVLTQDDVRRSSGPSAIPLH